VIHDFPYKSKYIDISGHKLHYVDEGEGHVILLLHGNPTWSYYYRHVIRTLSKNYRVIAVDHMGCGLSDKPGRYNYTLAKHIENLTVLIDSLDIASLSMVVHDWGGAIGFGYATRFAERIHSIVVLNTAAFRSQMIPLRIRVCRWPVIGPFIVRGLNGFAWPATFMAVTKKMTKDVARSYLYPYNSWKNRIAVYRFVKDIPLDETHESYSTLVSIENKLPELKHRNIPIMVLWGGKDFCFNDHFYNKWQEHFPDAQYHYFEKFGHYILEDGHSVVEPLIETFFATSTSK